MNLLHKWTNLLRQSDSFVPHLDELNLVSTTAQRFADSLDTIAGITEDVPNTPAR
jgi:hypothetical protein